MATSLPMAERQQMVMARANGQRIDPLQARIMAGLPGRALTADQRADKGFPQAVDPMQGQIQMGMVRVEQMRALADYANKVPPGSPEQKAVTQQVQQLSQQLSQQQAAGPTGIGGVPTTGPTSLTAPLLDQTAATPILHAILDHSGANLRTPEGVAAAVAAAKAAGITPNHLAAYIDDNQGWGMQGSAGNAYGWWGGLRTVVGAGPNPAELQMYGRRLGAEKLRDAWNAATAPVSASGKALPVDEVLQTITQAGKGRAVGMSGGSLPPLPPQQSLRRRSATHKAI